ncbi:MAG: thermonuclease family protein [Proteobacteria bacterium]|nr:thermonuclease family protein [Pseudomonadota bacterium]
MGRRPVTCRERDRDRFGRIVAVCSTDRGADIGRSIVKFGFAVAYRQFSLDYVLEEERARAGRWGLWGYQFTSLGLAPDVPRRRQLLPK